MATKQIASMSPWHAKNGECPFDCIDCEHLKDIRFYSSDDITIECDLEDNEDD